MLKDILVNLFTWVECFSSSSKCNPRFLTDVTFCIISSPILMLIVPTLFSCCLVPNIMNHILDSFNFRKFTCIQPLTSAKHNSNLLMQLISGSSELVRGLKLMLFCVSSAYPAN